LHPWRRGRAAFAACGSTESIRTRPYRHEHAALTWPDIVLYPIQYVTEHAAFVVGSLASETMLLAPPALFSDF